MDHVDLKDRSTYNREQVGASAQGLARREFAGDRRGSGVRPDGKALCRHNSIGFDPANKMNKAALLRLLTAAFGTKQTNQSVCYLSAFGGHAPRVRSLSV